LVVATGCAPAPPLRATWEYIELTTDEDGNVREVGDKHTLRSGGNEAFSIQGKTLDVVSVNSTMAKFQLSGSDPGVKPEVELKPGNSQDLWSSSVGVRLRVEKIAPID